MPSGFLKDIRVLDLGQYLPGPGAAQLLADMGADVLKVEPPAGDPLRRLDPVNGGAVDGVSPYYRVVNAGKRVLALDLKSETGKGAFASLAAAADVLIESFRPGAMERLGFGRFRLKALNPRLVHLALSGYGQTGPRALHSGHDVNYVAASGALSASGMTWPPVADHAAAQFAALAILGALVGRGRTGEGAFIDASLADTVLAWQAWSLTAASAGASPRSRSNVLNGGAAYYRTYATKDGGHVSLGAIELQFWKNFCAAVGRDDWIARQHEPLPQTALITDVAALFAGRARAEWDRMLGGVDCCYGPALDYAEVASDPQVAARGLVRAGDGAVHVAFPALVDGRPPEPRVPYRDVTAEQALNAWAMAK